MNLWILTSEFPPAFSGGGIGSYCIEFSRALALTGHNVTVFAVNPGATEDYETKHDDLIPTLWIAGSPPSGSELELGHWHRISYRMAQAVLHRMRRTDERPDAIEVQDFGALGYFLLKAKLLGEPLLRGIPIIVMCHTPSYEIAPFNEESSYRFPAYWIGRSEKFCFLAADQLLSPSQFLADRIGATVSRSVSVCGLPITWPQVDVDLSRQEGGIDLLYAGRFELRKGVMPLLAAMRELWDSGHRYRLHMVGGDTFWTAKGQSVRKVIEARFKNYIERGLLVLLDQMSRQELLEVMSHAKSVVVPSLFENYPYVCVEAMSMGVPVIGSKSGGQAEMIEGESPCGMVFDWSIKGDFRAKALQMMSLSSEQRSEMGTRARERVRGLSNPADFVAMREQMLKALNELGKQERSQYPFLNQHLDPSESSAKYAKSTVQPEQLGRLTVIVPHYNLGLFVRETVSSIMMSDHGHIEVLVIDDGSTDPQSVSVIDEIEHTNWRFPLTVHRIPNAGLANARNVGARYATSEFIAFLDSDDLIDPSYYKKATYILQKYSNVSYVFSWLRYFGGNNGNWINFDTEFPYFLGANMLAPMQVVRRADFLEYGQNDPSMTHGMEDYEAWIRMAASGCLGVSIPEPLSLYRVRGDSMSRVWNNQTIVLLRQWLMARNPQAFGTWANELLALVDANGPGWLWNNPARDYPRVGHVPIGDAQDELAALRWRFAPESFRELVKLFDEPAVVWLVQSLVRRRVHRLAVAPAKLMLWARQAFRLRGRST